MWNDDDEAIQGINRLEDQRDQTDTELQQARRAQRNYREEGYETPYLDQRIHDLEARYTRLDEAVVAAISRQDGRI